MFMTPHLDSHSTTDPKPEIVSAVKTGNRISRHGRNVRDIMHVHMGRKADILGKNDLTIKKSVPCPILHNLSLLSYRLPTHQKKR